MRKVLLCCLFLLVSCGDNYDGINKAHKILQRQHERLYDLAERLELMSNDDEGIDSVSSLKVNILANEILLELYCDSVEDILDSLLIDMLPYEDGYY